MANLDADIEIKNLSFSYKNQQLFKNYNFKISGNQFIGIIGVNGAGKSTLLKLIMGLLSPQKGEIRVLNHKAGSFNNKYSVGSSLQEVDFPSTEKVVEIIDFICKQFSKNRGTEKLITDFGLTDFKNKACGQLSGGMKRRVALACAFAGLPKIVLLDEPTTGLDHSSRKNLMEKIKTYQKEHQALVLMISHHPQEAMDQVDQFLHINQGQIKSVSTKQMSLLTRLRKIEFDCIKEVQATESLKLEKKGNHYTLVAQDADQAVRQLCDQKVAFNNLLINPLGADELMQEIL